MRPEGLARDLGIDGGAFEVGFAADGLDLSRSTGSRGAWRPNKCPRSGVPSPAFSRGHLARQSSGLSHDPPCDRLPLRPHRSHQGPSMHA